MKAIPQMETSAQKPSQQGRKEDEEIKP